MSRSEGTLSCICWNWLHPLSKPHLANTAIMATSLPSLSIILLSVWQVALANFSQLGGRVVGFLIL